MCYNGWKLSDEDRDMLMGLIPPAYPDVIAHHVTYAFQASKDDPLPVETTGQVIGSVDDGEGVQALVIAIGGTTTRPDGETFHLTWSIDRSKGFAPADSKQVARESSWKLVPCLTIRLTPMFFES